MNVANVEINPKHVTNISYDAEADIVTIEWSDTYRGRNEEYSKKVGPSAIGLGNLVKEVMDLIIQDNNTRLDSLNKLLEKISKKEYGS